MSNELTKKQKEFVKEYIKTGNGTQSALKAYDTDKETVAGQIASENLKKPAVINSIKSIAESIPDELLIERHKQLLDKIDKEGEIDVQAVSKGLDMAYKLKGTYAPEKNINLNIEVDIPNDKARLLAQEYENKLKDAT